MMMLIMVAMMVMKMIYICGRVVSSETGVVKDVGALVEDYI